MKIITFASLMGVYCVLFAGCASYTIQPVSAGKQNQDWADGKASAGYIFYQPELYFLVTPNAAPKITTNNASGNVPDKTGSPNADKGSGISVVPVYLPNPQKPYRVTTCNFLAKSDFAFNFKDGWQLSSIADKADNTTVANTIAGELKTILTAAGAGFAPMNVQQVFLLRPEYDSETGMITNLVRVPFPTISD